ncbi:NAD-dependent epimerase/dehydratase family protein [Sinosporangium album]|nr:NAD(P)-dependent oxidoreductase [Sinosporangium album]
MSRYLLFGGTGFIGEHVRAGLTAIRDAEVVVVSRETMSRTMDLSSAGQRQLTDLLYETAPAAIVNCVGATTGDPLTMTQANVVAVGRLLTAVARAAPRSRVVHLGSAAEYGAVPEGLPIDETVECHPVSHYGMTKLAGTELVRAAAGDGMDAVSLRVFNPVGPGATLGTLAGRLVARLSEGGDVRIAGLHHSRDFVDVRDVADAVVAAATVRGGLPPVLNIGSGRATAVRDLVESLVAIAAPDTRVVADGEPDAKSAAVTWQCADVTAAAHTLGWKPSLDLSTSLADLWAAHLTANVTPG